MDIFNVLTMIGGLSLFLFGMSIMGKALERRAGGQLKSILSKITTNRLAGFLTGLGVTAIIQSSSATTVMVVGFVNSGLLTLRQGIHVILGANVGTTITGWILSLGGIDSGNVYVRLLKPSSFTPVLALIGIALYMFSKRSKQKDTGTILLGFTVLMYGMETMTGAVSGLAEVPAFRELFLLFKNPILGLLAGAVLTAVIQSSSASVGILQALAVTGQVSYGAAIPIVMGDAIGTCVTAMLSGVGAKTEAKRAAVVHLIVNLIGAGVCVILYMIIRAIFAPAILDAPATIVGIAAVNTIFKVLTASTLLPLSAQLEKGARRLVPDAHVAEEEAVVELDERLLLTPALALEQSRILAQKMASTAGGALKNALRSFTNYSPELAARIRKDETDCDHYEDVLGTYLIKLSSRRMADDESEEATELLKFIGDFERISDHAVNILESAEELREKHLTLSEEALLEFETISAATEEILDLSITAFLKKDTEMAFRVEPLEQVIDGLKEQFRTRHILRMQQGSCSIEVGFVWSDLLTNLERTSDHCSNVAGCVMDAARHNLSTHANLKSTRTDSAAFAEQFRIYSEKYAVA